MGRALCVFVIGVVSVVGSGWQLRPGRPDRSVVADAGAVIDGHHIWFCIGAVCVAMQMDCRASWLVVCCKDGGVCVRDYMFSRVSRRLRLHDANFAAGV